MTILLFLAISTLSYWIFMSLFSLRGLSLIHTLSSVAVHSVQTVKEYPLVSIIVAAKEEEDTIRETIQHLAKQDYPQLELIVINDRSEDATGDRLEALKAWVEEHASPNLTYKVVHLSELPEGWLGKNHALYKGYLEARGELLLFTDADVIFQPHTVRDAVTYMQRLELDHLTLAPDMVTRYVWLRAFVHYFLFSLTIFIQPWRANIDNKKSGGMGVGAFNLVKRTAYTQMGTHQAIALRPDDDLILGRRLKKMGAKQRFISGIGHIQVEWYPSLREAIKGLEKNMFAGLDYSLFKVANAILGQLLFLFFPFVAVFVLPSPLSIYYGVSVLLIIALYILHIRKITAHKGWEVLLFPLSVLLFVYILSRSTYLTLRRGGVYWRGTFYSLKELKRMKAQ